MRYLGSKASTIAPLAEIVSAITRSGTFCDPFGGVGVVGAHFRSKGFEVHSGDLLQCAYHFQVARIELDQPPFSSTLRSETRTNTPAEFLQYVEGQPRVKSWVYREFSERRHYFTPENAILIDTARRTLARLRRNGALDTQAFAYYNACLVNSADRVANTAGTYYAYLKSWNRKSVKQFKLELIPIPKGPQGRSTRGDASHLVDGQAWDILYLDPPYNDRDYAAYYHLPETLATGRRPRPTGVSGVDAATRPATAFRSKKTAANALTRLLERATFQSLVVHYSDDGLICSDDMRNILSAHGMIEEHVLNATGYSNSGTRAVTHRIYVVTP